MLLAEIVRRLAQIRGVPLAKPARDAGIDLKLRDGTIQPGSMSKRQLLVGSAVPTRDAVGEEVNRIVPRARWLD